MVPGLPDLGQLSRRAEQTRAELAVLWYPNFSLNAPPRARNGENCPPEELELLFQRWQGEKPEPLAVGKRQPSGEPGASRSLGTVQAGGEILLSSTLG